MSEVISGMRKAGAVASARETVYKVLIPAVEDFDWDTQDECTGVDPVFDDVLQRIHPDWHYD